MIVLYILAAAAVLLAFGLWYAYHTAFRRDPRRQADIHEIPDDVQYVSHRDLMAANINRLVAQSYDRITIRSRDGLQLVGKYYAGQPGKPLILFFHGYRSTGERDASGGFWYCREKGYSLLMVDQRAHGESEGRTISFGIKERYDCLDWINEILRRFGPETEILLSGISMGGATVLMAAELPLPPQVKGIWADCGFASPEGVLRETIRRRNWPEAVFYPLVSLSARLFGGFRVEERTALDAVRHAKIPILLIHGEEDRIVPCHMAHALRDACASAVTLLTVPGAAHGVSYYMDKDAYWKALDDLFETAF